MSTVPPPVPSHRKQARKAGRGIAIVAAMVLAALGIAAGSIFGLRDIRPASAATLAATTTPAATAAVGVPASRDLIVPATTDAVGNVIPEHRMHFLFTHPIENQLRAQAKIAGTSPPGNLVYSGDVEFVGKVNLYLIFWQPPNPAPVSITDPAPFPADYVGGITNLFTQGSGSPLFSILTQYPDSKGNAPDGTVNVAGVYVDTTTASVSGGTGSQNSQVTDDDILNIITVARAKNPSWMPPLVSTTSGASVMYEVFTPPQVWENGGAGFVSFQQFCAYHSQEFDAVRTTFFPYAYVPYADSVIDLQGRKAPCFSQSVFPNGPGVAGSRRMLQLCRRSPRSAGRSRLAKLNTWRYRDS